MIERNTKSTTTTFILLHFLFIYLFIFDGQKLDTSAQGAQQALPLRPTTQDAISNLCLLTISAFLGSTALYNTTEYIRVISYVNHQRI